MPSEVKDSPETTLGEFLHTTRQQKGLDLDSVVRETRISLKNLQAMEENDFKSLPADAFARGFYSLYAQCLGLPSQEVLDRYDRERALVPVETKRVKPDEDSIDLEYITASSSRPAFSIVGLLLIIAAFAAFFCWYFSWNPVTYLGQKLQQIQGSANYVQPKLKSPEREFYVFQNMLSTPCEAAASDEPSRIFHALPKDGDYVLGAAFKETTKVTLAIDNSPVFDQVYHKGEQATWTAKEHIKITLPGTSDTLLTFNDSPIPLPHTSNATLTVSLPRDLLR